MSVRWEGQSLLQPISADQPCGENLEDTPLLAAFDALRLFGQSRSPEAPVEPPDTRKPIYTTPANVALAMGWRKATRSAANLKAHGHKDWRLPSKAEFPRIVVARRDL